MTIATCLALALSGAACGGGSRGRSPDATTGGANAACASARAPTGADQPPLTAGERRLVCRAEAAFRRALGKPARRATALSCRLAREDQPPRLANCGADEGAAGSVIGRV